MIDGGKSALLVIDVQQGMFGKSTPIYRGEALLENISCLIDAARRAGAPVIFVQHSDDRSLVMGTAEWQLHPRLQPLPEEEIIHKLHGNAFEDTPLQAALEKQGASRLVVSGLVTHGCVKATCLGALELGYRVTLARDAHSNFSQDAARIIEKWHARLEGLGVELRPTAEIGFG